LNQLFKKDDDIYLKNQLISIKKNIFYSRFSLQKIQGTNDFFFNNHPFNPNCIEYYIFGWGKENKQLNLYSRKTCTPIKCQRKK